jgi:hypothetical protein
MNRISIKSIICLIPFFCAGVAMAQESRGTISGRISDPTGAVVPGTSLQVINVETNVVLQTTSNESGNYQIPFVVPGDYKIIAEHAGFKRLQRDGVRVSTATEVTVDLRLEIGTATETMTVTDTVPLLETAGGDLGQVLNKNYLGNVTVNTYRNVLNSVLLTPGTSGGGGSVTGSGAGTFSIAGGGGTSGRVEYMVDGIPNAAAMKSGGPVYVPSIDAVEEIKVQTTMFDAAYGHSNGGVVNITTRGGTNTLHGTTYLYKQWAGLNANTWTNNRNGIAKPPVNYHQYGYLVSGPVYIPRVYDGRNRTFFSTTLERDRDARALTGIGRVPTALERQGDFSQTIALTGGPLSIYDPFSTVVNGTKATRQPFAGARIPAAMQSAAGLAWLNLYPLPNSGSTTQLGSYNWAGSGIYSVEQPEVSVRLDHNISDRNRIFGRFGRLERNQNSTVMIPGETNYPVTGTLNLGPLFRRFDNFGVDDTYMFSPTLIASLRYGFVWRVDTQQSGAPGMDISKLKLPAALTANQALPGLPTFNLGESLPQLGSTSTFTAENQHSLMAAVTKISGRHSLKFGVDYRLHRWNQNAPGSAAPGNFTFNNTFTRSDPFTNSTSNTSGTSMASLLLGLPASGSLGYTSPLSLQNHYLAGYIQEDWRVTPRLTLNFGMRWEIETPYTERYNRIGYGFDSTAPLPVQVPGLNLKGGVLFAGVNGNSRTAGVLDSNNFGPRFGFAYQVAHRTVIRGGYGLFYSPQAANDSYLGDVGVFSATTPFVASNDGGATPFATLANPFPSGMQSPVGASAGLMAQVGTSLTYNDANRVSPYSQQWQIDVQRELPSNIVVDAAYVGMLSLKQFESFNLNETPDRYLAQGAAANTAVTNPFLGVFPSTSTLGQGATITQSRLWVQYPQFTSLTVQGANTGRAIYHAGQFKVEKRFSHGLSILGNYTRSKILQSNITSLVNTRHYRTVAGSDVPNVFRVAGTYEFPWKFASKGWGRVLDKAAGGWSLSGMWVYNSGTPMGISQTNGRPIRLRSAAYSGSVESRLGDKKDAKGNVLNPYFDTTAFLPLASQYMVSPEAPLFPELRNPPSRSVNVSLFKTFTLYERLKLQFRADAISLMNSPNFAGPGTNMSNTATFGVIQSDNGGNRTMQCGLRLAF